MINPESKYRGSKEYHLVFCKLIATAQNRTTVSYVEVAAILGIYTPGNHMAKQVGLVLGEISQDEHSAGRPMLSAVAVAVNGRPSKGFYELARILQKLSSSNGELELAFWKDERKSVYEIWTNSKNQ